MFKVTQKQMAFYKLYQEFKISKRFIPTWEFVGEMHIPELRCWVMMSYKCPTRLTDIYQENDNLLEREIIKGKSGSKYYGYRFNIKAKPELIVDPALKEFYRKIKK